MTPLGLVRLATNCEKRWPTATLVKNGVGNLVVMVDGEYIAYLDLLDGTIGELP